MDTHLEHNQDSPYVTLFADDLCYMAGDAYRWGHVETGGGLYGLWSHAGRPVILLATPAGPGACNESAHFAQDADHLTQISQVLQDRFAIQYVGNWHSHHSLGLDQPSLGDMQQIHRVAAKNNIPKLIQLVLTRAEEATWQLPWSGRRSAGRAPTQQVTSDAVETATRDPVQEREHGSGPRITVGAFIYADASRGPCVRCPVKVLPGPNPVRAALVGSTLLRPTEGPDGDDFPLERIVCEGLSWPSKLENAERGITDVLAQQLGELPDHIATGAEVHTGEDLILLLLPLADGVRIGVRYMPAGDPPQAHSVWLVPPQPNAMVDITKEVLGDGCPPSLKAIYRRTMRVVGSRPQRGLLDKCRHSASKVYACKTIQQWFLSHDA
jgi:hypothetical protein